MWNLTSPNWYSLLREYGLTHQWFYLPTMRRHEIRANNWHGWHYIAYQYRTWRLVPSILISKPGSNSKSLRKWNEWLCGSKMWFSNLPSTQSHTFPHTGNCELHVIDSGNIVSVGSSLMYKRCTAKAFQVTNITIPPHYRDYPRLDSHVRQCGYNLITMILM